MAWAKVDDGLTWHTKIVKAGNEAVGAWVRLLAFVCKELTDGFVDITVATTVAPKKVLDRLVSVGLLELVDGGYRIHDFHEYNPPASVVRSKRETDKARHTSARTSARTSRGRPDGQRIEVHLDVQTDNAATSERRPAEVCADSPAHVPARVPVPVPDQRFNKLRSRESATEIARENETPGPASSAPSESGVSLTDSTTTRVFDSPEPESEREIPVRSALVSSLAPIFNAADVDAERARQLAELGALERRWAGSRQ